MVENDKPQFAKMLLAMAELYDKELTVAVVEIYWRILNQYSIEDIDQAFTLHASDPEYGRFMPKPPDIIRHIRGGTAEREGQAQLAWAKVVESIGLVGRFQNISFDDPAIMYAILTTFHSWEKLCNVNEKEYTFIQRDFSKAYLFYKINLDIPSYLSGLNDQINTSNGFRKTSHITHIKCPYLKDHKKIIKTKAPLAQLVGAHGS